MNKEIEENININRNPSGWVSFWQMLTPSFHLFIKIVVTPVTLIGLFIFGVHVFSDWKAFVASTGDMVEWAKHIIGLLVALSLLKIILDILQRVFNFKKQAVEIRHTLYKTQVLAESPGGWLVRQPDGRIEGIAMPVEKHNYNYRVTDADKDEEVIEAPTPMLQITAPREEDCFNLSHDCKVHADEILSGRGTIIGVSGSGKSNSVAVLSEECGSKNVPLLLADTEDEYQTLKPLFSNGMLVNASGLQANQGKSFGKWLIENHVQAVLNLQSYEMDEAALLLVKIITGMREWEEELESEDRVSSMVILEEAAVWLPQNPTQSLLQNPQSLAALQQIFFAVMVARGRKRGLGLALAAQRIAELDKRALQSSWKIYHRQTENTDLQLYQKSGIAREEAEVLRDGEAFLSTTRMSKKRVQMRKRYSPDGAKSPGLASVRRHQERIRNTSEMFSFQPEISDTARNPFVQPMEPLYERSEIYEIRNFAESSEREEPITEISESLVEDVPEVLRKRIIALRQEGKKRTEIQEELQINGDEYWMIKAVCDEYDSQIRPLRRVR